MISFYESLEKVFFRAKKQDWNHRGFQQKRRMLLEPLEDRQLLSVTPVLYGNIYTVDTLDDVVCVTDNQTSLREAIQFANTSAGRDLINFAPSLVGVITINGQFNITDDVDIAGNGADKLTISGNNQNRIFYSTTSDVNIDISNLTLANGYTSGYGGAIYTSGVHLNLSNLFFDDNSAVRGGGLYQSGGTAVIDHVVFSDNQAVYGGGIFQTAGTSTITATDFNNNQASSAGGGIYLADAADVIIESSLLRSNTSVKGGGIYATDSSLLSLFNSTISGNEAKNATNQTSANEGGGIYFNSTGCLEIISSTITNNSAYLGGGIRTVTETVLHNTIVAGNNASTTARGKDIYGTLDTTSSYNLIGIDSGMSGITNSTHGNQIGTSNSPLNPQLGELRNNGGATLTHALLVGSPAIDAGNADDAIDKDGYELVYDQRGQAYKKNSGIALDIGAFEKNVDAEIVTSGEYAIVKSGTTLVISPSALVGVSGDSEGAELTATITGTADHGTITFNPDGTYNYTPSVGFIGQDEIEYTVARLDGSGTETGTFIIEVTPPAAEPQTGTFQAVNDTVKVFNKNSVNYLDVLKNDIFTTAAFGQIVSVGTSNKGTVSITQQDGRDVIVFTPNNGATGSTTISYTVQKANGQTATASVTVNLQSQPSAWQGANAAAGNISIGGTNAILTPGSGFTPTANGNFSTAFTETGNLNYWSISGYGNVYGSGSQSTSVEIVSNQFDNGDWWYQEMVTWNYSFTDNNGDYYHGDYTYTLTASKISGLEQYTVYVLSHDSYNITQTTAQSDFTSSSTVTETQIGTTTSTILLHESYQISTGEVYGYDHRTSRVTANSHGNGTYQYLVTGGSVSGMTNSNSSYSSHSATLYVYNGTRNNITLSLGHYSEVGHDISNDSFSGSGTTNTTSTEGLGTSTVTTSQFSGTISESGGGSTIQSYTAMGNYNVMSQQWHHSGTGTTNASSWSTWKNTSNGTLTQTTEIPDNQRYYLANQNTKNTQETSSQTKLSFTLNNSGTWSLSTGSAKEKNTTESESDYNGSGTYHSSGCSYDGSCGCGTSPFDTWEKSGAFIDSGCSKQKTDLVITNTYTNGNWIKSGTGTTTGNDSNSYSYNGSGTYTKTIYLSGTYGSAYGGSGGQIGFSEGETTEDGEQNNSREYSINSIMDNYGYWTSTGTTTENTFSSNNTTYAASDGIFTVNNLGISGNAEESGENHESFDATLNYSLSYGNWTQVDGTQENQNHSVASLSYSGSGTTIDQYEGDWLYSRTVAGSTSGSNNGSGSNNSSGSGCGCEESTAYRKILTISRNISQSQSDESYTDTISNYINGYWRTTGGNGTTSGENHLTYDEDYSGTYDYGHRSWDQEAAVPETSGQWRYVSGTISGEYHTADHSQYSTEGTWNAANSKWNTTGTLNASASSSSQDEHSGSGNYLNVVNNGIYYKATNNGTITESASKTTTHSSQWQSVWGNISTYSEGWILNSGTATNTGNSTETFNTEGTGTFSGTQFIYGQK